MKTLRKHEVILFITIILVMLMSVSWCSAQIPQNIIDKDSNGIITEMNVSFTTSRTNQLFYVTLPYQYDYSESINSIRVYNSNFDAVPFHVWNNTLDGYIITIKDNVVSGNNTYYFTLGDESLASTQTTSVYDYYLPMGNAAQNITFPTHYTTGFVTFNYGNANQSVNVSFFNTTSSSNVSRFWYNNSHAKVPVTCYDTNNAAVFTAMGFRGSDRPSSSVMIVDNNTQYAFIGYYDVMNFQASQSCSESTNTSYVEESRSVTVPKFNSFRTQSSNTTQLGTLTFQQLSLAQGNYAPCNYSVVSTHLKDNYFVLKLYDPTGTGDVLTPVSFFKSQNIKVTQGTQDIIAGFNKSSMNTGVFRESMNNTTVNGQNLADQIPVWMHRMKWSILYKDTEYVNVLSTDSKIDPVSFDSSLYRKGFVPYLFPQDYVRYNSSTTYYGNILMLVSNGTREPIKDVRVTAIETYSGYSQNNTSNGSGTVLFISNVTNEEYYSEQTGLGIKNTTSVSYGSSNLNSVVYNYIELDYKYNITIKVYDQSTGLIVNTYTTFLGDSQSIKSTDNGTVSYKDVLHGEQEVIIQADGYNQVSRGIFVSEMNEVFNLYITKQVTDNEIITPLFVTIRVFNGTSAPVYGYRATVTSTENNSIMYDNIMNYSNQFTVKLERGEEYKLRIIKESTEVDKVYTLSGLNDGDSYTIVVFENYPTGNLPNTDKFSVSTPKWSTYNDTHKQLTFTVSATDGKARMQPTPNFVRLQYTYFNRPQSTELQNMPFNSTGYNTSKYTVSFLLTNQQYNTFYNQTHNASSRVKGLQLNIPIKVYPNPGNNTVNFSLNYTQPVPIPRSLDIPQGDGILDLGLTSSQYNILAWQIIILQTIQMQTQSNVPYTILTTIGTTLFFMWMGWIALHQFTQAMLALGLAIQIALIFIKNKGG